VLENIEALPEMILLEEGDLPLTSSKLSTLSMSITTTESKGAI